MTIAVAGDSLPAGWELVPLKRIFRLLGGATPADRPEFWDGEIPWVTPEDLGRHSSRTIDGGRRSITRAGFESCGTAMAAAASIVLSTRAPIGHVAIAAVPLCTNQGCKMLEPRGGDSSAFYWYVLQAARPALRALGTGTTFAELSRSALGGLMVPRPPLAVQVAVAKHLDRDTSEVDSLIEQKQRLVALLEESLLATAYQALSRGLGHTAGRPSGLPWLAAMPSHWTVEPLRARYSVQLGKMLNPNASGGANVAPYLRNVNVQWDRVDVSDLNEMAFDDEQRVRLSLRHGDLLVCEGGEVGRTAIWRGELEVCYFQKAVHRLRRRAQADVPRYLYYVMRVAASAGAFRAGGNRSTIVHLTKEKLQAHRLPFPPPAEQAEIVAVLDGATEEAARLQELLERQLSKLRERRAALITAAVTGQLAVTAAA